MKDQKSENNERFTEEPDGRCHAHTRANQVKLRSHVQCAETGPYRAVGVAAGWQTVTYLLFDCHRNFRRLFPTFSLAWSVYVKLPHLSVLLGSEWGWEWQGWPAWGAGGACRLACCRKRIDSFELSDFSRVFVVFFALQPTVIHRIPRPTSHVLRTPRGRRPVTVLVIRSQVAQYLCRESKV